MVSKQPNQVDLESTVMQNTSHLDKASSIVHHIAHITVNRSKKPFSPVKQYEGTRKPHFITGD